MADTYIVTSKDLGKHHDNEADAMQAAKVKAADPNDKVTHVYVYKLICEVDGADPLQLDVKHYSH